MSEAPEQALPSTIEESVMRIRQLQAEMRELQAKVIRAEVPVAEYNQTYKERLAAIHALEAHIQALQTGGGGHGHAGHGHGGHGHGKADEAKGKY